MVKHSPDSLDVILKALADGTRRGMLARLLRSELSVSELAEPYEMSLAAVSKHLKVLEAANLVEKKKQGRNYQCRANLMPLVEVTALLDELGAYWRDRLQSLEAFLSSEQIEKENPHGKSRKK